MEYKKENLLITIFILFCCLILSLLILAITIQEKNNRIIHLEDIVQQEKEYINYYQNEIMKKYSELYSKELNNHMIIRIYAENYTLYSCNNTYTLNTKPSNNTNCIELNKFEWSKND